MSNRPASFRPALNHDEAYRTVVVIETMESRRMLSADLVPSFAPMPPAEVLAGGSAKLAVRVANVGDQRASGAAQVTLFASADATLDAADAPIGQAVRALRLQPGKSTKLNVGVQSPSSLGPGDYTIFARVDTGSSAIQDANAGNDVIAAPAPLSVREAYIDLVGRFTALPDAPLEAFAGGGGSSTTVEVTNAGSAAVRAGFDVAIYLSSDGAFDAGDVLLGTTSLPRTTIKSGTTKNVAVTLAAPPAGTAAGRYTQVAVIDPGSAVAERDEGNNVALSPGQVPVVDSRPPSMNDHHHHDHSHDYYSSTFGAGIDTYYYYDDGEWYYTDERPSSGDDGGEGQPPPTTDGSDDTGNWPTNDTPPPPSSEPTTEPTSDPTTEPTTEPTSDPTDAPTSAPTDAPTSAPTDAPTDEPSPDPAPDSDPAPAPSPDPEPAPDPDITGDFMTYYA